MPSYRKQKEALRGALYAFFAGAHYLIEEVEKTQSLTVAGSTPESIEARHIMLEADYERLQSSTRAIEDFSDLLDEEGLYPFGSEWPRVAFSALASKLKLPKLSFLYEGEPELRFRFQKGFRELLKELSSGLESTQKDVSALDHWMALLLNTSFHAGLVAAAHNAENSKIYYSVISEVEEETEPWGRYPQIAELFEKQLSRETRRRTGLVSDLDF